MMKLHASTSSSSIKMATSGGGLITLPNLNLNFPYCSRDHKWSSSSFPLIAAKFVISPRNAVCYAESSGAASTGTFHSFQTYNFQFITVPKDKTKE
ncbi:hypothetical protein HanOQP8_Chr08g0293501 [Helianthus annuus]|nr:hypothetical protein HanLR1_Chr08g0286001 [Helianthus annuus]KAJ0723044.1 hypothetical protein HanOQP8_Chr08g0293501 [Helianthus annuus]